MLNFDIILCLFIVMKNFVKFTDENDVAEDGTFMNDDDITLIGFVSGFCEYEDIGRYLNDFDFFPKWILKVRVDEGCVSEKRHFMTGSKFMIEKGYIIIIFHTSTLFYNIII